VVLPTYATSYDGLHNLSMNESKDQSLSSVYVSFLLHNKWQLKMTAMATRMVLNHDKSLW